MGRGYSWAMIAGLVILIGGCSPEAVEPAPDDDAPLVVPAEEAAGAADEAGSATVTLERPELPGDVFFEDPLAIAANSARLPEAVATPVEMTETEKPTVMEPEETETAEKAAIDWASLLSAELLNEEMLRIRDRFAPKLEGVASFNNSLLELPPYLAEMTALAVIATRHAEDVPWRANAKYVRELAAQAAASELRRGQASYERVKTPFDKISTLLDGKKPAELPEATEEGGFLLTTDFGYLMRRLEIGQNSLRINGSSEEALSENSGDLNREARVMAALAAVIASEDYGYGEDQAYQGYANELREAALNAAKAAETTDFAAFDTATNMMMQSCNRCHSEYRTL